MTKKFDVLTKTNQFLINHNGCTWLEQKSPLPSALLPTSPSLGRKELSSLDFLAVSSAAIVVVVADNSTSHLHVKRQI